MKFRELIFHIGFHKTGSTSLQNWLLQHREILEKNYDIYYPSFAANHSFHFNSWFNVPLWVNHLNVLEKAFTADEIAEANARRMREFMAEAEATSASRMLISAENLSAFEPAKISSLMDWAQTMAGRIRVIGFVRHPGEWLVSLMQQALKGKRQMDGIAYFRHGFDSVVDRLDQWREAVGKDAFQIRDFRQACESEGGLLATFCALAKIAPEVIQNTDPLLRINESLSSEGASVLSVINTMADVDMTDSSSLNTYLHMVQLCQEIQGQRFTVPEAFLQNISTEFKSGADRLKAGYGIDYDLENYAIPKHVPSALPPETVESLARLIMRFAKASPPVVVVDPKERAKVVALREQKALLRAELQRIRSQPERSLLLKLMNPLLRLERSFYKRLSS